MTAVGAGVDTPIGTRVMSTSGFIEGHGSFAEYTVVAADQAFPVPSALDDAAAAGFWIPHMTGWAALVDRGRIAAGDWLAVLGAAGGSGIAAVQLGNALGARVIAVVGDEAKADFCRGLGAEAVVVHRNGKLAADLRAASGGVGVDLILRPGRRRDSRGGARCTGQGRAAARRRVRQRPLAEHRHPTPRHD